MLLLFIAGQFGFKQFISQVDMGLNTWLPYERGALDLKIQKIKITHTHTCFPCGPSSVDSAALRLSMFFIIILFFILYALIAPTDHCRHTREIQVTF